MKLPEKDIALTQLLAGDRVTLGRLISVAESPLAEHRAFTASILEQLPAVQRSRRIGITGVPGVGKSTFINVMGMHLISEGAKVAVLAVDPSSQRSGGSILGDKTRMTELSTHANAFVRPSPTSGHLGGVNAGTRNAILLCEAAGYDTILIETVGVGQSETAVENLVDFLLLLMMPGAGDELQGIKRGIMEIADAILINKADGMLLDTARLSKAQYNSALRLFPPHPAGWKPPVQLVSSEKKTGLPEVSAILSDYFELVSKNGYLNRKRSLQEVAAFREITRELLMQIITNESHIFAELTKLQEEVALGIMPAFAAAEKIAKRIRITF